MAPRGPALGVLELSSVARGVVVADAAVKRAPVVVLSSRAVSGGKHLVFLEGGVAEVDEAVGAARAAAGALLVEWLLLPGADAQVWTLLGAPPWGAIEPPDWSAEPGAEAVAIVETTTVCAAIAAADAACKAADVTVRDVRLAIDLAGKAYFTLTGTLDAVQASAEAAGCAAEGRLAGLEVIAQPAPELRGRLFR
jgi:microcompartment protein CcmL/EutN